MEMVKMTNKKQITEDVEMVSILKDDITNMALDIADRIDAHRHGYLLFKEDVDYEELMNLAIQIVLAVRRI
jgi:hypothetical protein